MRSASSGVLTMIYLQLVNGAAFKVKRAKRVRIEGEMWVCRDSQRRIVLALDRKIVAMYSQEAPAESQATELP
jgi:hypothetical protein